jgi:Raf kinase inhibitor-like YbhB/YbcL family protein
MNHSAIHTEATKAFDFKRLKVSSSAFKHKEMIPSKYTCDGDNVSPPLDIENIPEQAKCLALIVDDPDAPGGMWVHWVVWNIPVTHHIRENAIHGVEGINDFKKHHYGGPCPPSGTHRYFFKVYALDSLLDLPVAATKQQLEKEMSGSIIAFGELIGLYKRKKSSK